MRSGKKSKRVAVPLDAEAIRVIGEIQQLLGPVIDYNTGFVRRQKASRSEVISKAVREFRGKFRAK